jgi:hypothetical protein
MRTEDDPRELHDLASSLHALGKQVPKESFDEAATILASRTAESRRPDELTQLAQSLGAIAPDLDPHARGKLGSILAARIRGEHNPNLLRPYGEVLAAMPEGSFTADEIGNLAPLFLIPNAPCQIAALARGGAVLPLLVRQISNPWCSEEGWDKTVAAFDGLVRRGIVHRAAAPPVAALDDDFVQLVEDDDDGEEASAALTAIADSNVFQVDFNKLSDALDASRQFEGVSHGLAAVGGILLCLAGAICLIYARACIAGSSNEKV